MVALSGTDIKAALLYTGWTQVDLAIALDLPKQRVGTILNKPPRRKGRRRDEFLTKAAELLAATGKVRFLPDGGVEPVKEPLRPSQVMPYANA